MTRPANRNMRPLNDQPHMMAIGESVYNGMRSLTIDGVRTRLSAPAMIASALGLQDFSVPDLPQPVVVDLEKWMHWAAQPISLLNKVSRDITQSVKFWAPTRGEVASPSGALGFENLAFAGARIEDLYTLTPRYAAEQARLCAKAILAAKSPFDAAGSIGDMVVYANARFTLSPAAGTGGDPFWDSTPLDIVAHRQPKRLLVFIGTNDGFMEIVLKASPDGAATLAKNVRDKLPCLAKRLAALRGVDNIYFNLLPKPSAVSSLMPMPDLIEERHRPPASGYWPGGYENRVGIGYGTYTPDEMKQVDNEIWALNQEIKEIVLRYVEPKRIAFVDCYDLMACYDSKNHGVKANNVVKANGITLTNNMLMTDFSLRAGGLQGLDGVHLTAVGSVVFATAVLEAIAQKEGLKYVPPSPDRAFRADTLLTDPPFWWSVILWAYRDIRRDADADVTTMSPRQRTASQTLLDVAFRAGAQTMGMLPRTLHGPRPRRRASTRERDR